MQTQLEEITATLPGSALVAVGDRVWSAGDVDARYPIYSVTKSAIAAAVLLLAREGAVELATVRRFLDHTSGIRDYGSLPAYHEAVRSRPGRAWSDDEFVARASADGPLFAPGDGWAYSNTGYLLLRRLLDENGGLALLLSRLALGGATVAETPEDYLAAAPAASELIHDGVDDVRGRYDPRWVGHRSLVASVGDLLPFWSRLPVAMTSLADAVPVGYDAPGFVRPSYGLGVMVDSAHPMGVLFGHGGGGPGYAAAVFTVPSAETVAIVLAADERYPAQATALALLAAASRHGR